jgi:uncharacterized protein (TIGR02001 family)
MKTLKLALVSALAASSFSMSSYADESKSSHSIDYNLGIFSQYIFRGLQQTNGNPALQGSIDYSHESGLYVGTWLSTISWARDAYSEDQDDNSNTSDSAFYDKGGRLEMDFYAGFANEIGETGVGYDLGVLRYQYPGSKRTGATDINTTEVYAAVSYGYATLKNSWVVTDTAWGWDCAVGTASSSSCEGKGTTYTELGVEFPLSDIPYLKNTAFSGIDMELHVGRQEFEGSANDYASYTDYKVGLSKEIREGYTLGGFWTYADTSDGGFTYAGKNVGGENLTVFLNHSF